MQLSKCKSIRLKSLALELVQSRVNIIFFFSAGSDCDEHAEIAREGSSRDDYEDGLGKDDEKIHKKSFV